MTFSVLVVDDEPSIRENLSAYLEDEGMQVETVLSCEEAMERLQAGARFDACIMDIRLPGMDGNSAMLALRALAPALEFVVHTGTADYSLPDELRAIGITDARVFKKPLMDMAPLARCIRSVLRPTGPAANG
jgi:CheY-like chemotaxis protein